MEPLLSGTVRKDCVVSISSAVCCSSVSSGISVSSGDSAVVTAIDAEAVPLATELDVVRVSVGWAISERSMLSKS